MSTDNFVWTDELRKEFNSHMENVHYGHNMLKLKNSSPPDYFYHIETFKASKQKSVSKGKDFEIESYINTSDGGIFTIASVWDNSIYKNGFKDYTGGFRDQPCFAIHSVRRLSDNSVFTIGDEVSIHNNKSTKIQSFSIVGGGEILYVGGEFIYSGRTMNIELSEIIKSKPILFTTEDGREIFEGDEYWFFYPNYEVCKSVGKKDFAPSNKTFSTEDAANEYILFNKPCLSMLDILCYGGGNDLRGEYAKVYTKELKQLAQSKQ